MNLSVLSFGALPGSPFVQTAAFQRAIDACFASGGGEVSVPAGTYRIGGIRLRSGITLRLLSGAELVGSRDLRDYRVLFAHDGFAPLPEKILPDVHYTRPEERTRCWHSALIHIYGEENVSILGEPGSVIDGANVFDPTGEENYRGPHAISALYSKNLCFSGYTVKNSSNWAHIMWFCSDVLVDRVTVFAGHDGVDFFASDRVTVRDCTLHTGDDCIAGFDNFDVLIEGCELNSSCSDLRFSATRAVIRNCRAKGPGLYAFRGSLTEEEKRRGAVAATENAPWRRTNTFAFFTYYFDYRLDGRGDPGEITIENTSIESVDRVLFYFYDERSPWSKNRALRNIAFRGVSVKDVKEPFTLVGTEAVKASLSLSGVSFSGCKSPLVAAKNVDLIALSEIAQEEKTAPLVRFFGAPGKLLLDGEATPRVEILPEERLEFLAY